MGGREEVVGDREEVEGAMEEVEGAMEDMEGAMEEEVEKSAMHVLFFTHAIHHRCFAACPNLATHFFVFFVFVWDDCRKGISGILGTSGTSGTR